ncbi:MAG: endonuclease Q family protein [bacterium]|nr:endonuclease Q family protein [bacterium]
MKFIADLHTHSKYARACSPALTLENMDGWARVKGVDILSTGDFTHPKWFEEIKRKLVPSGRDGLYVLKDVAATFRACPEPVEGSPDGSLKAAATLRGMTSPPPISLPAKPTLFMLGTELACIYSSPPQWDKQGKNKVRRVHLCIYAPSIEVAGKINAALTARGCKLGSDGRAIIGMSSKELLRIILEIDPRCVMIPAHIWTPWFAVFGSNSGFDSLEECFEELTPHIFAIETGLSSNPPMNWRVKELDNVALVSFADAHSLPNLGREATVFEGEESALSYNAIMEAIRNASPNALFAQAVIPERHRGSTTNSKIVDSRFRGNDKIVGLRMSGTIEFIPDEGKYHYDGHRACKVCLHPSKTKKLGGVCPKCKKPMTIGVLSRIETLANQPEGRTPKHRPQFWSLVELDKIIAEAEGVKGRAAKKVEKIYWELIAKAGTEMNLLLNLSLKEIADMSSPRLAEAIKRVREGKVKIDPPGYDGEYGVVQIFSEKEKAAHKVLF